MDAQVCISPSSGPSATQSPGEQQDLHQPTTIARNVCLSNAPDRIFWRWSNSGIFSVRSAYSFMFFDGVDDCYIPHIWSLWIPLRVKIFMWLAAKNRLLTTDFLTKRGWLGPSMCFLCGVAEENISHILLCCSSSKAVWIGMLRNFPPISNHLISSCGDVATRWCRTRLTISGNMRNIFDICFAALCWELWNERNIRIVESRNTRSEACASRAISLAKLWISVLGKRSILLGT